MRTATDVKVSKNVFISRALYNGKTNRERALTAAKMMQKTVDILGLEMNLPKDLKVRICTFRGKTIGGSYSNHLNTAAVALREIKQMVKSLSHELVHAEQWNTGRLKWDGRTYHWMGNKTNNKGSTYAAYRSLPWEAEAFDRQNGLMQTVLESMGIKF